MTIKERISHNVRRFRRSLEITQAEVARNLGLHRVAVSEIEKGGRLVKAHELAIVAKLFGVSMDDFIQEPPAGVGRVAPGKAGGAEL